MQTRSSSSRKVLHAINHHDISIQSYNQLQKSELNSTIIKETEKDSNPLNSSRTTKTTNTETRVKKNCYDRIEQEQSNLLYTFEEYHSFPCIISSLKKRKNLSLETKTIFCGKKLRWDLKEFNDMKGCEIQLKKPCNTLDPIMLNELGPYTFNFVRPNQMVVQYNIESLIEYILCTGNFSEPETRIEFNENDLLSLDMKAKKYGFNLPSVMEAKKNYLMYEEKKIQRDGVLGLERCAGNIVSMMLKIIETDDDPEEGELQLIMDVFPSFTDLYNQLQKADTEYARQCMEHYKDYIQGPPNHPTDDIHGFLPIVLNFLDGVSRGEHNPETFGFT